MKKNLKNMFTITSIVIGVVLFGLVFTIGGILGYAHHSDGDFASKVKYLCVNPNTQNPTYVDSWAYVQLNSLYENLFTEKRKIALKEARGLKNTALVRIDAAVVDGHLNQKEADKYEKVVSIAHQWIEDELLSWFSSNQPLIFWGMEALLYRLGTERLRGEVAMELLGQKRFDVDLFLEKYGKE